jgi:hypothetical protein
MGLHNSEILGPGTLSSSPRQSSRARVRVPPEGSRLPLGFAAGRMVLEDGAGAVTRFFEVVRDYAQQHAPAEGWFVPATISEPQFAQRRRQAALRKVRTSTSPVGPLSRWPAGTTPSGVSKNTSRC